MKNFSFWNLCLAVMLSTGYLSYAQSQSDTSLKEDEQLIEFTTDRFTLPNLHVTPDKKHIIFDVLGDIYQVPIEGGKAEVLLQDSNWKRGAKLSSDGKTLAYVSDESGEFQVWTYDLNSEIKRVYPIIESFQYPLYIYWSRDNELLVPTIEGLISFKTFSKEKKILRKEKEDEISIMHGVSRTMFVSSESDFAYFQKGGKLWKYNINRQKEQCIGDMPNQDFFELFKISPDGKTILFYEELNYRPLEKNLIRRDLKTQSAKVLNTSIAPGNTTRLNYSFDFIDDSTIVLDKEGKIVKMNIETGAYKPIPIEVDIKKVIKKPLHRELQYIRDSVITASVLRNPVTKPDLDTIYFGAFGKLHTYSKATGAIKEVFPNKDLFEVSPSLSPNGKYLAYTTWNDWEMGHLYVRELSTGRNYQITQQPGRYINPAWSPDGTEIVFIADETETRLGLKRLSPGTNTSNFKMEVHHIIFKDSNNIKTRNKSSIVHQITPSSLEPNRFYPIPVFHPCGKSIFLTKRNLEKNLPVLVEIDLKSKSIKDEKLIPFNSDETLISPNAKHIAFIYGQQVWIDNLPFEVGLEFYDISEFLPKTLYYEGGVVNNISLPNAKPIYEIAPSYLSWQDEYTLMWGSADEIYTYDMRTQETKKTANIRVQKERAIPRAQYALTNAQIITMNKEDEIIEKGTILIKNNRIEAVGRATEIKINQGYKTFDLSGKTIIPGLVDVHAHIHYHSNEFMNQQEYQYIGSLAYGVTTAYDPHANTLSYREQAQMVEVGKSLGPRVFSSGNIIFLDKTYPSYYNLESKVNANRLGKSLLKIGVSGPIKDYDIINSKHKDNLRSGASMNGLGITTHQEKFVGVLNSISKGYTSIEHDIRAPIQEDLFKLISYSGVNFTPTYVVTPDVGNTYYKETDENKLIKFYGGLLFNNLYRKYYGKATDSILIAYNKEVKNRYQKSIEKLRNLVKLNTKISVGGHGDPLPGIGTHYEIWFLTNGMDNYQALRAATINGAEKLDLQEEIGSVEAGKLADMLILNNNPLINIFSTTDIKYTILNGNMYNADNMNKVFPKTKELRPWGRDSPIVLESMQNIYIRE